MQLKDSAAIAYSAEPQVLTINVLKSGAMNILQELAKLKFISLNKPIMREDREDISSYEAGKKYFGKYGSGNGSLSKNHRKLLKKKLYEKFRSH
jgi:hypothetical protein